MDTNIAPDEHVQPQLMFDYDGKRDRWNGYNPEEHMKIVEEYAKVDLVSTVQCFPAILKECIFWYISSLATLFFVFMQYKNDCIFIVVVVSLIE